MYLFDLVNKNRDVVCIYPFLKNLIFFIIGIFFSIFFKTQLVITLVSLSYIFSIIFHIIVFAFYKLFSSVSEQKIRICLSINIHLNLFCAGIITLYISEGLPIKQNHIIDNCNAFEVCNLFEKKSKISNMYFFCANLRKICINNEWIKLPKKIPIILFLDKKLDKSIFIDSVVQISSESKKNIKFLKTTKSSFFQTNAFATISIAIYNVSQIIDFKIEKKKFVQKLLNNLISTINENIKSNESRGVILCLLFGDKNKLNKQLTNAYIAAGIMHLLAVSGLHVGIIYFVINSLLSIISRNKKYFILKHCIIITFLWIYALLCGMSSSVLRATIMFSLKSLEDIFFRANNVYNKLFISAFIILFFNPQNILDIGFQLSYLSVIGITYFTNKIYSLFIFKSIILKSIWKSISVSLSAQILTLPISLFYFHNLSIYSIISNILMVPYTFIILYISTFFILLSKCSFLTTKIGILLEQLVKFQNSIIYAISNFPFCNFSVHINFITMISIYLLIVESCLFLLYKRFIFLLILVTSVIIDLLFFFCIKLFI